MKLKSMYPVKRYSIIGLAIVIIALAIWGLIVVFSSITAPKLVGDVTVKIEDSSIISGEQTYLLMSAYNDGEVVLTGKFVIQAEDQSAVTINPVSEERLSFELYPKERIERRIGITGISKAARTDYEINVLIQGDNETIISEKAVYLTVKKE